MTIKMIPARRAILQELLDRKAVDCDPGISYFVKSPNPCLYQNRRSRIIPATYEDVKNTLLADCSKADELKYKAEMKKFGSAVRSLINAVYVSYKKKWNDPNTNVWIQNEDMRSNWFLFITPAGISAVIDDPYKKTKMLREYLYEHNDKAFSETEVSRNLSRLDAKIDSSTRYIAHISNEVNRMNMNKFLIQITYPSMLPYAEDIYTKSLESPSSKKVRAIPVGASFSNSDKRLDTLIRKEIPFLKLCIRRIKESQMVLESDIGDIVQEVGDEHKIGRRLIEEVTDLLIDEYTRSQSK